MTQSWHDLLFAHWPVDARTLQEKLPSGLPLDTFDGQAWLGVVPFRMTNVAPRGVPAIPFVSSFIELNVRTYVTLHGKPGVYFFSLDANSTVAVTAARALFGQGDFVEVHVSTSLEVCETRDPKGLYRKARAGQIPEFTGISAPYEAPERPELVLDTGVLSVEESVASLIRYLEGKGYLAA